MSNEDRIPFIHRKRNKPQRVRFTDESVIIDLADGRAIAAPLHFFPRLQAATDTQRNNYKLHHVSVNWEELDAGIDLIAMLTGLYREPIAESEPPAVQAATT